MTQRAFAAQVGIDPSWVSKVERGAKPSQDTLDRIVSVVGPVPDTAPGSDVSAALIERLDRLTSVMETWLQRAAEEAVGGLGREVEEEEGLTGGGSPTSLRALRRP